MIWIDYGPAMEVCDFGLDRRWVGEGLWILVWIGEVGLLWFEQRFCGLAMVWAKVFSLWWRCQDWEPLVRKMVLVMEWAMFVKLRRCFGFLFKKGFDFWVWFWIRILSWEVDWFCHSFWWFCDFCCVFFILIVESI